MHALLKSTGILKVLVLIHENVYKIWLFYKVFEMLGDSVGMQVYFTLKQSPEIPKIRSVGWEKLPNRIGSTNFDVFHSYFEVPMTNFLERENDRYEVVTPLLDENPHGLYHFGDELLAVIGLRSIKLIGPEDVVERERTRLSEAKLIGGKEFPEDISFFAKKENRLILENGLVRFVLQKDGALNLFDETMAHIPESKAVGTVRRALLKEFS
jgi:hypothetical protein